MCELAAPWWWLWLGSSYILYFKEAQVCTANNRTILEQREEENKCPFMLKCYCQVKICFHKVKRTTIWLLNNNQFIFVSPRSASSDQNLYQQKSKFTISPINSIFCSQIYRLYNTYTEISEKLEPTKTAGIPQRRFVWVTVPGTTWLPPENHHLPGSAQTSLHLFSPSRGSDQRQEKEAQAVTMRIHLNIRRHFFTGQVRDHHSGDAQPQRCSKTIWIQSWANLRCPLLEQHIRPDEI